MIDFGYEERERFLRRQRRKVASFYTGANCPNCNRNRLMKGEDGKSRCEKCAWCVEDNEYDFEFLEYMA